MTFSTYQLILELLNVEKSKKINYKLDFPPLLSNF